MSNVIYVVDYDCIQRDCVIKMLSSLNVKVIGYKSASIFLSESISDCPSCLILEMNMPSIDGFQVIDNLKERGCTIPILVLTVVDSIPVCVRAMRAGVRDFLTKPVQQKQLLDSVKVILGEETERHQERKEYFELCEKYKALTFREKEIFEMVINGLQNKQIAFALGISEITVKVHRRRVMDKMKVSTLADLVHCAGRLQVGKSKCVNLY